MTKGHDELTDPPGPLVYLTLDEMRQLLRILESLVLSIDWITSSSSVDDCRTDLLRYFRDGKAWFKLSNARYIATIAINRVLPEVERNGLLEGVEIWGPGGQIRRWEVED